MELRRLGRLMGALAIIALAGCAARPQGVIPLAGDGSHAWVYVQTPDGAHDGIWLCTTAEGPEPRPRCVQADWMKWRSSAGQPGTSPPAVEGRPTAAR